MRPFLVHQLLLLRVFWARRVSEERRLRGKIVSFVSGILFAGTSAFLALALGIMTALAANRHDTIADGVD